MARTRAQRPKATARARRRAPPKPSRLRGLAIRAIRLVLGGLLLLVVAFALLVLVTWPDLGELEAGAVTSSAFIEAYAEETGRRPRVRWRPYAEIDDDLKLAILVAEDARFFEHGAFDMRELKEALEDRIEEGGRLRGASTLSQQLTKNLWLSPKRSYVRKFREALYTMALEHRLSKRRILEIYLNVVEMGPGVFGAEAAARRFFDRGAGDLTLEQAAMLAATLSRPSIWYPGVEREGYRRRVQHILREMERASFLRSHL